MFFEKFSPIASAMADVLREHLKSPAHAYIFTGSEGAGKKEAARVFAAGLITSNFSHSESEKIVRQSSESSALDCHEISPAGAKLLLEDAEAASKRIYAPPISAKKTAVIIDRFHTATADAAASLLKAVEEPPGFSYVIILAEHVKAEHDTIFSRCVHISFPALDTERTAEWIAEKTGISAADCLEAAAAAKGNIRRTEILAADEGFPARKQIWENLPALHIESGCEAASAAQSISDATDAAQSVLSEKHETEMQKAKQEMEDFGLPASHADSVASRHKRETRKFRESDILWGMSLTAEKYRDSQNKAQALKILNASAAKIRTGSANEDLVLQWTAMNLPRL